MPDVLVELLVPGEAAVVGLGLDVAEALVDVDGRGRLGPGSQAVTG